MKLKKWKSKITFEHKMESKKAYAKYTLHVTIVEKDFKLSAQLAICKYGKNTNKKLRIF